MYRIELPRSVVFVKDKGDGSFLCLTEDHVAGVTGQYQPDFSGVEDEIELVIADSINEVINKLSLDIKYVRSITEL